MDRPDSSRLVSADWLSERLSDPGIRVIEVSSSIDDQPYREGHIPGALWWHWKTALWHETDREFPEPEDMAKRLGKIGVSSGTTVVLYGEPVQFGTYAFWVLTMCGHRDVRILNGGRKRWAAEGKPFSVEVPGIAPVGYEAGSADPSSRVGRDDVRSRLGDRGRLLLDVRSTEEYRGERVMPPSGFDHGAERAGRIPGAAHLFYRELVNEDDTFKSEEELRGILSGVNASPGDEKEIVLY